MSSARRELCTSVGPQQATDDLSLFGGLPVTASATVQVTSHLTLPVAILSIPGLCRQAWGDDRPGVLIAAIAGRALMVLRARARNLHGVGG